MQPIFAAAGGLRALARGLCVSKSAVAEWATVPQRRLFAVAAVTGLDPAVIRPDLADWVAAEKLRRRKTLAFERFGLARVAFGLEPLAPQAANLEDPLLIDLVRLFAACRVVSRHRALPINEVLAGRAPGQRSARALACAIAKVAGEASSSNLAVLVGFSRQNVDNAAERYLRACDGDDPEDVVAGRVMENGRLRRVKLADPALLVMEQEFAAILAGDDKGKKR
jgi:hypothetical protein